MRPRPPRTSRAYRPLSLKRRAWLTLGAVVIGGGGLATYAAAGQPATPGAETRAKRPVKVYDFALKADGAGRRELPRTETGTFSMLGVSWTGATKQLNGTAQVRTRAAATGTWSAWRDLEADADPLRDPAAGAEARGASEPLWVGPSDGVQVQVVHEDGTTSAGLPTGLRVDLVDPGIATAAETRATAAPRPAAFAADGTPSPDPTPSDPDTGAPTPDDPGPSDPGPSDPGTSTPSPSTPSPSASTPTPPPSTVPAPPVTARAGWGADESISPEEPEYNTGVKAVFVHHSTGSNTYACADSASLVRGVYAYHVLVNGWKDIGYNFLVDKCGTIFEGRKGGTGLPVLGAHTYGWNRDSTGVAVLGDHTATPASDAALASIARIAAWKLGQYGAEPTGTVQLTAGATQKNFTGRSFTTGQSYPFERISAHRDGFNTECPGGSLYAQLPAIRTLAAGPVQGLKLASLTGAALSGSTYWTKGAVTPRWSATTPAALIKKYEVLVDGKSAATAAGSATSATVTPGAGSHTVAVRAVHQSGLTVTTAAVKVATDTTAPTFPTAPTISLRTGTVETATVPVVLGWKAADAQALKSVELLSPTTAAFGPTVTSSARTAKSGSASVWSMRATDAAGNTRTASPSFTPVILQETSAVKSGTWSTRSSSSYLGGKSYSSGTKNASLTWTFTGRSASWVVSRAAESGKADVYVDGKKVTTVDLKSSTTRYRQAIWTKTWSGSAKHTVKIVVSGTGGRPTVTTDGLVYVK
ncbi:peptidoglycan recognition protein [Streptomyces griseoviridis]